jgi:hypothetical protein
MFIATLLLLSATACSPMKGFCERPISADSIADSVGVNIHLHFGDTVYSNFPLIRSLLVALGVRHTRDGLVDTNWKEYYDRHIALGRLGIKCLFITSPEQSSALLTSWPSRVPGAFEGYEAPNEYDLSRDPKWSEILQAFVRRLYRGVKSDPATASFPLVGPSVTQAASYTQLAGLQQYFDLGNMHNYFGGRNPGTPGWGEGGYGSIAYNISLEQLAWPGKPIVTTETGYITDTTVTQGIPENVAGKYAPRMILEQALHGISRTYIYELIDEGRTIAGKDAAFGLARMDGSQKPAFEALKNLIATLSDPGPQISHEALEFSLAGAPSDVHHLLMAKRDGSYYLAFWEEEQGYDFTRSVETPVAPETFAFTSSHVFKTAQLIAFSAGGSLRSVKLTPSSRISLVATDCVSILRLQ